VDTTQAAAVLQVSQLLAPLVLEMVALLLVEHQLHRLLILAVVVMVQVQFQDLLAQAEL
jgi:hypothetical protein